MNEKSNKDYSLLPITKFVRGMATPSIPVKAPRNPEEERSLEENEFRELYRKITSEYQEREKRRVLVINEINKCLKGICDSITHKYKCKAMALPQKNSKDIEQLKRSMEEEKRKIENIFLCKEGLQDTISIRVEGLEQPICLNLNDFILKDKRGSHYHKYSLYRKTVDIKVVLGDHEYYLPLNEAESLEVLKKLCHRFPEECEKESSDERYLRYEELARMLENSANI